LGGACLWEFILHNDIGFVDDIPELIDYIQRRDMPLLRIAGIWTWLSMARTALGQMGSVTGTGSTPSLVSGVRSLQINDGILAQLISHSSRSLAGLGCSDSQQPLQIGAGCGAAI